MMTPQEVEIIAHTAAKAAVDNVFERLGLDVHQPLEAQRDFAWLRDARTGARTIRQTAVHTGVVSAVSAIMGAILAFASWRGGAPH